MRLTLGLVPYGLVNTGLSVFIPDKMLSFTLAVMVAAILMGLILILILYGTYARNRWGINFQPVNCPHCREPMPRVRKPRSHREWLWGGATCDRCGCEIDKWGNPITS